MEDINAWRQSDEGESDATLEGFDDGLPPTPGKYVSTAGDIPESMQGGVEALAVANQPTAAPKEAKNPFGPVPVRGKAG